MFECKQREPAVDRWSDASFVPFGASLLLR
jgi:hypothetical protein